MLVIEKLLENKAKAVTTITALVLTQLACNLGEDAMLFWNSLDTPEKAGICAILAIVAVMGLGSLGYLAEQTGGGGMENMPSPPAISREDTGLRCNVEMQVEDGTIVRGTARMGGGGGPDKGFTYIPEENLFTTEPQLHVGSKPIAHPGGEIIDL